MTKRFYPSPVRRPGDAERESKQAAQEFLGAAGLELEDEAARAAAGYDPYDTVPNARHPDSAERQADLRRLSEWIRAKRQADQNRKPQSADPADLAATLPGDKPFWPGRR